MRGSPPRVGIHPYESSQAKHSSSCSISRLIYAEKSDCTYVDLTGANHVHDIFERGWVGVDKLCSARGSQNEGSFCILETCNTPTR